MMLSNLLQMNMDQTAPSPQGVAGGQGEGEAGGFLTALLQSGGLELSEAELQALQQMLTEQGEAGQRPDAGLLAALQDLLSERSEPAEALAGLNMMLAQTEAEPEQGQDPDPEQLLGLMLAARRGGSGERAAARREGVQALAARSQQEMLWSRDGQSAGQAAQADSALNAVSNAQQNFHAALNKAAEAMPQLRLEHPVQQPGFSQAVGERVSWMANQGIQQARIQLNPAHLGPLEISISVQDEQTQVAIVAQHALTRDTLQADMPRLREMLADNGFTGVDVNVAQDQQGREAEQRAGGADAGHGGNGGPGEAQGEEAAGEQSLSLRRGQGLVDHYA